MRNIFKKRKTLYIILSVVMICVFTLTIAYSALNTILKITGSAEVVASSWDIHLDNVKVTSGSVSGTAPSITSPTTATFSTRLATPGDFYEFSIDVVNNGSIDAMIDGVTKTPTLTAEQAKYLNYIVEYQNGESINNKQLVAKGSFVRLKVRVEYRKDLVASDLPSTSQNLNLAFTVNYVQSDGNVNVVPDNGTGVISFFLDGSEYEAREGMTWQEFIDSNFNPEYEGLKIFVANTYYNDIEVLYKPEKEYMTDIYLDEEYENKVYLTDTIIAGFEYYDG